MTRNILVATLYCAASACAVTATYLEVDAVSALLVAMLAFAIPIPLLVGDR